jgi:hypothetical protein
MKTLQLKLAAAGAMLLAGNGLAYAAAGDSIHVYEPSSGYLIAGDQAACNQPGGRYAAAEWTASGGAEPSMKLSASSCGVGYRAKAEVVCQWGTVSQPVNRPTGAAVGVRATCIDLGPASEWYGEIITY